MYGDLGCWEGGPGFWWKVLDGAGILTLESPKVSPSILAWGYRAHGPVAPRGPTWRPRVSEAPREGWVPATLWGWARIPQDTCPIGHTTSRSQVLQLRKQVWNLQ